MQQGLRYRSWLPAMTTTASSGGFNRIESQSGDGANTSRNTNLKWETDINADSDMDVRRLVSENAVIVFGRRGCCMCHVVKLLLQGLGVNPTVFDVDESDEAALTRELSKLFAGEGEDFRPQLPAIFVGGKQFGGLERVMASHISGDLVPILKEAGALWL